jgi:hypothetical protein
MPVVNLNPDDFVIVPNVYVLDEFEMTDDDGKVVARIDEVFIRKLVARMVERENVTGDLCPFVIGHTKDNPQGDDEINGPKLVGYFRNWKQIPFFDTGKTAAAPDVWIFRDDVELVKRFPRRSSEVWVGKYEIDPVSALGATTPARDLGLLKLDANMRLTVFVPVEGGLFTPASHLVRLARDCKGNCTLQPTNRETEMANEANPKPAADPKESGSMKEVLGKLDMMADAIMKLTETVTKMTGGAAAMGAQPAAGAQGAVGGDDDQPLTDDELTKMLAESAPELGGDEGAGGGAASAPAEEEEEDEEDSKSRKGEKPVKNSTSYAGGDNTQIPNADVVKKLQRYEDEMSVMRLKLARSEIKDRLATAAADGADIDPNDDKLVTDLLPLPDDLRESMIVRLSRKRSISAPVSRGHATAANQNTASAPRRVTEQDKPKVMKLARAKGIEYAEAAAELGFKVG